VADRIIDNTKSLYWTFRNADYRVCISNGGPIFFTRRTDQFGTDYWAMIQNEPKERDLESGLVIELLTIALRGREWPIVS